ncbi:FAD-dependent monooxygenase [Micromonospora sp. Llam7]|uniref:FAD-dependent oxidoreductase n=1 Tax=Micromonospora tarapacensis TaxID=2835305 RepID=UPI001C831130|nr:NAD(P)/FAD-dependent oxidoreductase [Micromonospora tarapacensis]MBX7268170.1 FAD-dependent monooxygenase [Micromonospora tarapacensis]
MKVAIIGAGVAGVGAALGLLGAGHEVEVYEQAGELRAAGNGVILWPNGTGILREFGIDLDGLGIPMDMIDSRTDDGYSLARIKLAGVTVRYGSPTILAARGDLLRRMADRLPEERLHFGKLCVGITEARDQVTVEFADGSEVTCDVLIGADGHRSVVRRHLFGDRAASYTGWASWHGITSPPIELAGRNHVQSFFSGGGVCGLHPVGDGRVHWVFETPWADGETVPRHLDGRTDSTSSIADALRSRFGRWASPVPELLDSIHDDDISLFPHILHEVLPRWGTERVTLAGDAVHAIPPRAAMGVNQALEDAWVLSRVLVDSGPPARQLLAYENARRPYVERLVNRALKMERLQSRTLIKTAVWFAKRGLTFAGPRQLAIGASSNFLSRDLPMTMRRSG